MAKRQFILETIKKVFQKYCFQPLETPAMEDLTTLMGMYGNEGDQLLFRILESGEFVERNEYFPVLRSKFSSLTQDFFDNVNNRVGLNRNIDIQPIVMDAINDFPVEGTSVEPSVINLFKEFVINDIPEVSLRIKDWLTNTNSSPDVFERFQTFFLSRNKNI